MNKYAIVIVSKIIDRSLIQYYRKNLCNDTDLFYLSPNFDLNIENEFKDVSFIKDKDFFNRNEYKKLEKTVRPNWYYQQFLKYSTVVKLYKMYNYDLIHIIDGDTYIHKNLFLQEKLFYTSKNIEKPYQHFISQLNIGLYDDKNFIINHMCFRPRYLINLLNLIAGDKDWINFFIDILISNPNFWFSEYQLYANFVKVNFNINEENIKVFRRVDLLNIKYDKALEKYPVVSKEIGHKNDVVRKLRAYLYYFFNLNLG